MRFGLLGTGPWAQMAHAPGLAAHPDVEFAGVWGRTESKASALASEFGVAAFTDVDALLAEVDAVAIALPPAVQGPLALRAAEAGKHLLLDKPVALSVAEAETITGTLTARNLASVVFFTRRFLPSLSGFIDEAVETGGWVEARVDHVGTIYDEGNPFGESPWRRESGGLWDVGPHAVAMVVPVLGPVTEVAAMVAPRDMTHLLLRHASGAVSRITLSVDVPPAAAREEATFFGEAGIRPVPPVPWEAVRAFQNALDALLSAAAGGPPSPMDAAFGTTVTQILVAAEEAAATGRSIKLVENGHPMA
jgi:predicted dehydrogenase